MMISIIFSTMVHCRAETVWICIQQIVAVSSEVDMRVQLADPIYKVGYRTFLLWIDLTAWSFVESNERNIDFAINFKILPRNQCELLKEEPLIIGY